jgi:hypothetical protein
MNYLYNIYGINLSVPFQCPMLQLSDFGTLPDVTVSEGIVMSSMSSPLAEGHKWQASPRRYLFRGGPRSGKFLVEDGTGITFERNSNADDQVLCAHLLASVIVALLRQRGQLVLHANVIMTPRGAIAISGESGSGKSTTQASLLKHGCQMVTDDITVLKFGAEREVVALPGIPKMNLCEDAAIKLGHDVSQLPRSPLRHIKVVVPVLSCNMITTPVRLISLYLLKSHSDKNFTIDCLAGAEKLEALQDCIYGPLFPEEHQDIFPLTTSLIKQVDMIRIARPSVGWSMNKVVETILNG